MRIRVKTGIQEGLLIKPVSHKHTQLRAVVAADPGSGVDVHNGGLYWEQANLLR